MELPSEPRFVEDLVMLELDVEEIEKLVVVLVGFRASLGLRGLGFRV